MTRLKTVLVLAVAVGNVGSAQIHVHDFKIDEWHRSQQLALLMVDAAQKYPELAHLNLNSQTEERKALFQLGNNLASEIKGMGVRMSELSKRVTDLESGSYTTQERELLLKELKENLSHIHFNTQDLKVLASLAERSYPLSRTYRPPPRQLAEWRSTWRTVKRLIPRHM